MIRSIFLVPLAMVLQGGFRSVADAQQEPATQHVRIEITTSENGKTNHVVKEFDAPSETDIQDSLQAWGINTSDDGDGAYLGVSTADMNNGNSGEKSTAKKGVRVVAVVTGTPAEKAGLKEGDVITAVDGVDVDGPSAFAETIRGHEPNDVVRLSCLRNGKKMTIKATLAERSAESYMFNVSPGDVNWSLDSLPGALAWAGGSRAYLGVTSKDDADGNMKGATIGTVEPGSAADSMGIQSGDVITRIGKNDITDFDALSSTVRGMEPGDDIAVTLQRDGREMTLNGRLGKRPGAEAWAFRNGYSGTPQLRSFNWNGLSPTDKGSLQEQIDRLQEEVDELLQRLGTGSSGPMGREMRITIKTMPLSQTEKDLLKSKGVTNLDKELKLDDVQLYPNPSPGQVHLRFGVPTQGDLTVDIHDPTGERIYHETISAFTGNYDRTLDLSDKSPGSYFVVIAQDGRVLTRKLIRK